jgi:glycosyltransferase involved in cell wall biosynthesis
MHILIVHNAIIPAVKYGGTERVIFWLGKELVNQGHKVTYLVAKDSTCSFADVIYFDNTIPLNQQIPNDIDVVHLNSGVNELPSKPYVVTMHGNLNSQDKFNKNTIFVSQNHAARYGSDCYVHNGLDPDDYGKPSLKNKKNYIHFLGDAAWRVKNVKGAISIASKAGINLKVIGGKRLNISQGFRFTLNLNTSFCGMVGGKEKNQILDESKGLLFPVRWHEPFGLAITESLYFGCPVFATPYGSLPEIINKEVGFLSNKTYALVDALKNIDSYNPTKCYEYVMEYFTSKQMAKAYLGKYETVLNGHYLNETHPCLIELQQEKFLEFE